MYSNFELKPCVFPGAGGSQPDPPGPVNPPGGIDPPSPPSKTTPGKVVGKCHL